MNDVRKCCICESEHSVSRWGGDKKNYCKKHYSQMYEKGKIIDNTKLDPNLIIYEETFARVILKNIKNEIAGEGLVSLDKLDLIKPYRWYLDKDGYVVTYAYLVDGKRTRMLMHRLILNAPKGKIVDHINGVKYDNRNENIRICSCLENSWNKKISSGNSSGVTGIRFRKDSKKWDVKITVNGKVLNLGCFENFEDAVKVRREAEKKYFGEFAPIHNDEEELA